jgi:hypothetical protein
MMRYESPATTKEACALLAKEKGSAFVLAGGTDLLVKMKAGMLEPDLVVDIKRIKGMREIKKTASGFVIGAATPNAALSENKALLKAWPGVVEAAQLIGSKQVQGRCTMAGNLCNASPAADAFPLWSRPVPRSWSSAPRASASSRSKTCPRCGPHRPQEGRDHRGHRASGQEGQVGRCLSALHSAHRNGHRRGPARRQPDH